MPARIEKGMAYCAMCTHTVDADIIIGRTVRVRPGQHCPRCQATLDTAVALPRLNRAA